MAKHKSFGRGPLHDAYLAALKKGENTDGKDPYKQRVCAVRELGSEPSQERHLKAVGLHARGADRGYEG